MTGPSSPPTFLPCLKPGLILPPLPSSPLPTARPTSPLGTACRSSKGLVAWFLPERIFSVRWIQCRVSACATAACKEGIKLPASPQATGIWLLWPQVHEWSLWVPVPSSPPPAIERSNPPPFLSGYQRLAMFLLLSLE